MTKSKRACSTVLDDKPRGYRSCQQLRHHPHLQLRTRTPSRWNQILLSTGYGWMESRPAAALKAGVSSTAGHALRTALDGSLIHCRTTARPRWRISCDRWKQRALLVFPRAACRYIRSARV
jgi:hypothetical protein